MAPPVPGPLPPHLQAAAAALEGQRGRLGDAAVDAALEALRASAAAPAGRAPAVPAGQERRQVTIVFLDVVGSTRLSQHLDPEDIQHVIDGLLARCTACIEAHGGRVLQYAGDSLLAAFGADRAQEDDADRAMLAGLDLLALGREQGREVQQRHGQAGFDVRLGAHTGDVLLGGGVDAEGSIRGMAVNVAARLEQLAPPGALRISRDTWQLVRGRFDLEEQPPLVLKGLDEPVRTYLVRRALPQRERDHRPGLAGLRSPLVGRAVERAALEQAHAAVVQGGRLQALTVLGEAGLGKSRLLAEFEAGLPDGAACWRARAHPHSRGQLFGLVRDLLCRRFGIAESDDTATALALLQAGLQPMAGGQADEAAALLGQLIGLDCSASPHVAGIVHDARQLRSRAFHLAGGLLARAAAAAPAGLVLLLDDVHWADDASLDFFEAVAQAAAAAPLLVLCGARPQLREHRPAWGQPLPVHAVVELAPLDDRGAALVDALLAPARQPVPAGLRELLLHQADGNPFYLEELLLMLVDDGVIDTRVQPWPVHLERLGTLRLPTTLTGVLQARLDSLPPAERDALQQASVVGAVFWDGALRAAAEPHESPEAALDGLERRGPVRRRDTTAFAGNREYGFRHHLLQQVTYDTVLRRRREPLHRVTAHWLVAAAGDRIGEHAALIAEHFERASDNAEAVAYLLRAADSALRGAAPAMALAHTERAVRLLPPGGGRQHFEIEALRCQAFNYLARREEQAEAVRALLQHAGHLGEPAQWARAEGHRSTLLTATGDYEGALAAGEHARRWAAEAGQPQLALPTHADTGLALQRLGRPGEGVQVLERAVALAARYGRPDLQIVAMSRLSALHGELGHAREHLDGMYGALALAERVGNLRMSAGLRSNLGVTELHMGDLDRAAELLGPALATLRAIGDRGGQGYTLWAYAALRVQQGEPALAIQAGEEALALAAAARDRSLERGVLATLILVGARCGEHAKAAAWLARYDALATGEGQRNAQSLLCGALLDTRAGRLDAARGQIVEWLRLFDAQEEQPGGMTAVDFWPAWECLRACGLHDDARRILALAWRQIESAMADLPEARRADFVQNIAHHRHLAQAWAAEAG